MAEEYKIKRTTVITISVAIASLVVGMLGGILLQAPRVVQTREYATTIFKTETKTRMTVRTTTNRVTAFTQTIYEDPHLADSLREYRDTKQKLLNKLREVFLYIDAKDYIEADVRLGGVTNYAVHLYSQSIGIRDLNQEEAQQHLNMILGLPTLSRCIQAYKDYEDTDDPSILQKANRLLESARYVYEDWLP